LAAATKLCELLEGAEDCFRSDKRESISAGAKRVWLVRRLHLAIYRRQSSGQLLAVGETSSRQHAAIRRHEQGPKEAGILFRGYNDLLRVPERAECIASAEEFGRRLQAGLLQLS